MKHAIRTACQVIGRPEVIVVGSQAILGTFREDELPAAATMSIEVDSPFEQLHGFSIDGVDLDTAILPAGWRDRLVRVQNANTAAPGGQPTFTGWCLDKQDLCVAKLCAVREKDRNFVVALLRAHLVDARVIRTRLASVPGEHLATAERARLWIRSLNC